MPDPSPEFDAAWAHFQTLDRLVLGPETLESAWAHGRDRYAALLIPVDDQATVAHIHGVLRRLGDIPGVEPYPEPYWHITIKGIGFVSEPTTGSDEVSPAHLKAVLRLTNDILALQPPFEVQTGRVNAFAEVVLLEVWDGGRVRELNTRMLEAVPDIIRQPFDGARFLPHISIARFTSDEGLPQLKAVLAELRRSGPGPAFTVGHIDLISAHLSAAAPTLERLRRYHLSPDT
jgi:2'-5' RNA ligase